MTGRSLKDLTWEERQRCNFCLSHSVDCDIVVRMETGLICDKCSDKVSMMVFMQRRDNEFKEQSLRESSEDTGVVGSKPRGNDSNEIPVAPI